MIKPCTNCHPDLKKNCERLISIRQKIKGLGLKFITISCKTLQEHFRPGRRVEARIYNSDIDRINGTIIGYKVGSGKIVVWLDEIPGQRMAVADYHDQYVEGREIVKIWPRNLTILDEPDIELCTVCNRPKDQKNLPHFDCSLCERGITPEEEMRQISQDAPAW